MESKHNLEEFGFLTRKKTGWNVLFNLGFSPDFDLPVWESGYNNAYVQLHMGKGVLLLLTTRAGAGL